MNYGEDVGPNSANNGLSIVCPPIEIPLDDLLTNTGSDDSHGSWSLSYPSDLEYPATSDTESHMQHPSPPQHNFTQPQQPNQDVHMHSVSNSI
jgi:hypothetical protein